MKDKLDKIIKNISWAMTKPRWGIELFWRRMFPKDPETQRIGSWIFGNIPKLAVTEVFPGIEDVDVIILRAFDRLIGTSLDIQEILVLSAIVKFTNAKSILEIGTYDGNTALNLAVNSPVDALITTIDLPADWKGKFELKVPESYINTTTRSEIGAQYKNTKYAKKIKQIFGDSAKIDWSVMSVPFDVVFIDGCHYHEYVKKDTESAMRYLKSGGILIWHDYGMIKDVTDVVDETAKKIKVKVLRSTRLAVGYIE